MCEKDFETLLVKYIKLHRYELEKRAERFDDTVMDDILKDINRAKSSERGTICTDL